MDIIATVDSLLLPHVERTIVDAKDKLIEAVRHRYRSQDEIGVIMKFPDKGSLNKTIVEMGELGVIGLKDYIFGKLISSFRFNSYSNKVVAILNDVNLNLQLKPLFELEQIPFPLQSHGFIFVKMLCSLWHLTGKP